ncbi:MAG: hypothetical protein HY905_24915 [Deltaproteobacteria bacterium]|nr:hypothetical protein [Deltaproteobacteria bacterium]
MALFHVVMDGMPGTRNPARAPWRTGALSVLLPMAATCYSSRGQPDSGDQAAAGDAFGDAEEGVALDGAADAVAWDPLPDGCGPAFPAGSVQCLDGVLCPTPWTQCCATFLCGDGHAPVRACCGEERCNEVAPRSTYVCRGAPHEGEGMRAESCGACPDDLPFCCTAAGDYVLCADRDMDTWICAGPR